MARFLKFILVALFISSCLECFASQPYIVTKKVKIGAYNSIVNAIFFDDEYQAQITYGKSNISSLKRVSNFVKKEDAIAGINASYFKPDSGTPLGLSIINNQIITGPLFKRSCFGIKDNKYYFDKVEFNGSVNINNNLYKLTNINQPITSSSDIILYDKNWGDKTPENIRYSIIGIKNKKVCKISNKKIALCNLDYAVMIPTKIKKEINLGDTASYNYKLSPQNWNSMDFAVAAGPCLIKNGEINVKKENFSSSFLKQRAPRSAIGTNKYGQLALITVDGRQRFSKGVSLYQFAKILKNLGIYNAINLDGGSSTQFVYKNKLQNRPSVRGGAAVTNAIIIKRKQS